LYAYQLGYFIDGLLLVNFDIILLPLHGFYRLRVVGSVFRHRRLFLLKCAGHGTAGRPLRKRRFHHLGGNAGQLNISFISSIIISTLLLAFLLIKIVIGNHRAILGRLQVRASLLTIGQ
jgi:hypothetical protein